MCSVKLETCGLPPEIDLFATQVNTQLAMFASWKPDPEAPHIDAFTIDWSQYKFSFLFQMLQESTNGQGRRDFDCTNMADTSLVAPDVEIVDKTPTCSSTTEDYCSYPTHPKCTRFI